MSPLGSDKTTNMMDLGLLTLESILSSEVKGPSPGLGIEQNPIIEDDEFSFFNKNFEL